VDGTTQLVVFGRIALGAGLGFAVGLEREIRGKAAGERTISLVGGAAAAFAALAAEVFPATGGQVLAGVATGVGFLGIGIIWRGEMGPVRGLTTAAAVWTVAGTGVLAGLGLYLAAPLAAGLTVLILELQYVRMIRLSVQRAAGDGVPPPPTMPDA
jgi:putative Mg2+ transporter-C (MgtC) family protein